MTRPLLNTLSVVALMVTSVCAFADATSDAKKAIQAQYDKASAGYAKKDAKTVLSIYAPDYESVNLDGAKRQLDDVKKQLPNAFSQANSIQIKALVQKVTLKGDEAFANVATKVLVMAKHPEGGPPLKVELEDTGEYRWVKRNGQWLLRYVKKLTEKRKVNGQVIVPKGGQGKK
jgi:uncharacterized protein (TIGR02246 family)